MSSANSTRQTIYLLGVITSCIITIGALILSGLMFFFSEDRTYIPTLLLASLQLAPTIIILKSLVSSEKSTNSIDQTDLTTTILPVTNTTETTTKDKEKLIKVED
jgi:hypothetical protein